MSKFISIEKKSGGEVVVNPRQICSVYEDVGTVLLRMSCGHAVATKFTDVAHAVDYIERALYVASQKLRVKMETNRSPLELKQ